MGDCILTVTCLRAGQWKDGGEEHTEGQMMSEKGVHTYAIWNPRKAFVDDCKSNTIVDVNTSCMTDTP